MLSQERWAWVGLVGVGASDPSGSVVNRWAVGWFGGCKRDGGGDSGCSVGGRRAESDGKGGVEATSKKGFREAIDEAMDSRAEGPAEDCVNGDIVAKSDGQVDW